MEKLYFKAHATSGLNMDTIFGTNTKNWPRKVFLWCQLIVGTGLIDRNVKKMSGFFTEHGTYHFFVKVSKFFPAFDIPAEDYGLSA